jgi:hypothetical protein
MERETVISLVRELNSGSYLYNGDQTPFVAEKIRIVGKPVKDLEDIVIQIVDDLISQNEEICNAFSSKFADDYNKLLAEREKEDKKPEEQKKEELDEKTAAKTELALGVIDEAHQQHDKAQLLEGNSKKAEPEFVPPALHSHAPASHSHEPVFVPPDGIDPCLNETTLVSASPLEPGMHSRTSAPVRKTATPKETVALHSKKTAVSSEEVYEPTSSVSKSNLKKEYINPVVMSRKNDEIVIEILENDFKMSIGDGVVKIIVKETK